jgi:peptidoglycan/xylan/chitin deacetylase (PgdA/CDA1 family)
MLKVAVTHDVDRVRKTYHYLTKSLKAISNGDFKIISYQIKSLFSSKNSYWNFEDIIELENSFRIKSTFFFLNESIGFNLFSIDNWHRSLGRYSTAEKKVAEIIKELYDKNFEIGVHGSFNSGYRLDLLQREKMMLEKIVGEKIIGIRQHYLNLNDKTWALQKKAGFLYDSSWGYTRKIGYKDDKVNPFAPFNDEFTVFPMTIMDTPFVNAENKWELLDQIIKKAEKNNAPIVLNWHTDSFNEKEFPNFRSDFIKIIETLKKRNAGFFKLSDLYNQKKEV